MEKTSLKLVKMTIEGMRCSMCESHVNECLLKVEGVYKAKSSHVRSLSKAVVSSSLDASLLKKAVEKDGYRVLKVEEVPLSGSKPPLFF